MTKKPSIYINSRNPSISIVQPVNSDEHDRPGGEEDEGGLGVAGELAEDLLTRGQWPVVVQQVQQRQRHREHAEGEVRQRHVGQQHITGAGQPLQSDDMMRIVIDQTVN